MHAVEQCWYVLASYPVCNIENLGVAWVRLGMHSGIVKFKSGYRVLRRTTTGSRALSIQTFLRYSKNLLHVRDHSP